jgi:excisionase family DNA binding protein
MQLVSVKEIAILLCVKESTVYQWAELGQIPSLKLNGSLRFDLKEVIPWIQSCKRQPDSDYNPILRLEARKGGRI